ncbi:MAG: hypothetical protein H6Q89_994 [Myxococcaceae bacterium]|nr:hypothetical protein [Myxococcaceae bacterium]
MLLAVSAVAHAEESVSAAPTKAPRDAFQARLRYGVSVRSGSQLEPTQPSLTYSGLTPNDLALNAWGWFLLDGHLGAFGSVQREAFTLFDAGNRVTGGGLIRASVGPAGRLILGPVKLEAAVGYAFHQLPTFGTTASPAFSAATRHGVLLAARGIVDVGPVSIEARGEVPISVAASDGAGRTASSSGYAVGGGVRLQLVRTGALMWGLLADVSYVSDSLSTADGLKATQSMIRAGGALDLKWQEASTAEAPRFGGLEVRVVEAQTGAPLPGAQIELGEQQLIADATGAARVSELLPGAVRARASAEGYLPEQAEGMIAAGSVSSLELKLTKEGPKLGGLLIRVSSREAKTPVAGATVKVGAASAVTDAQGAAKFGELPPGPIAVAVSAEGYTPGEEAASVVAGRVSEVSIGLVEVKKRVPATITGLVRSTAGGKPVSANLEIPQAKLKTRASASGSFSFRVEGGTYTVNISAPGYLSQSKSVTVKDGDQAIFNVDLHPK